ncbi:MAG: hypothetical protein Q4F81_05160 [Eubacteriales bacterium]|nr:hypothetical protein [Eubacteriales bacterium]
MAKTTSQIQAEKKKLRESFAPTEKKLNDTHAKQMAKIGYTPEKEQANLAAAREANKRREQNVSAQAVKKAKQEANKTAVDKMWDRHNQPRQRTEEDEALSALLKARRNTEQKKKELEDYQNTEYDWTDAAARELYEKGQKQKEAEISKVQAEQNAAVANFDRAQMNAMSEEDRALIDEYIRREDTASDPIDTGTAAIVEHFVNQNAGIDEKRLKQLVETRRRELNAQRMQETQEKAQEEVNDGWMSATWANLKTVPANLVSGAMGTMSYIHDLANQDERYSGLDPNSMGNQLNVYSGAVRGQTQQNIVGTEEERAEQIASLVESGYSKSEAEFIVNKGRQGLAALYQAGMSAADTGARAAVGGALGLGAGFGATVAGLNTFSQTMSDASARGATPEQALALAVTTAGIEAATEKVPLDNLIKVSKGGGAKSLIKNILRQAGIEATEEELSLIGTTLADAAIMQEKSEYNLSVAAYMASGMTEEQAREQANWDLIAEAGETAIVSGIAGGIGGFGASAAAAFNREGLDTTQQGTQQAQTAQNQQDVNVDGQVENDGLTDAQRFARDAQRAVEETGAQEAKKVPKAEPAAKTPEQIALEDGIQKTLNQNREKEAGKQREKEVYESLKAAQREQKNLQKEIDRAEAKLRETGKGSPARIDQLKQQLEQQNNLVKQLESQQMYFNGDYERNVSDAIRNQQSIFDSAKERAAQAISDYESGKITEAQKNAEVDAYNRAGAELKRLSGMTQEQYRADLAEAGLAADMPVQESNAVNVETNAEADVNGAQPEIVTQERPAEYDSAQTVDNPKASAQGGQGEAVSDNAVPAPGNGREVQKAEQGQEIPEGMKGTGAAEKNFSGKAAYQDSLTDENTQRDRPGDVRPVEVPKTDANGRKVSEFVGNAYGAAVTPDSMANEIESLVQDGALGFDRRTNKQSLENAAAYIEQKTPDAVRSEISKNIGERKIQDGDIEKAVLLYTRYANQKGQSAQDSASEIMVDLATMANISGRNLQLFGLMRRMTPEGQLMTVEKTVQRNIENLQKAGKVKKGHVSDIDAELKQDYLDAAKEAKNADTPQKQKDAARKVKQAEDAIYLSEAAKMPTTFKAKWDAWRYMAMMGNVKTNVRNVAGNVSFMPYKAVKDKMGALAEKLLVPKEKRTKALIQDSELVAWAKADAKTEQVRDALKYSAKIGDDVSASKLAENQQIFKNKALEGYRKLSEKLPAAGDMLFKNEYYSKSLAGFLKARGYSAADVQSGKVNAEILNEARGYAIDEAMKATFNDCNAFSDFVANDLRYKGDNPFGKALNLLGEGVLPFRRTPANIVARATEYSPIGVAKGVWDAATKVRNGEMTAATAIDHISAGLTGTAAMALGYALARGICGVKLTGSDVSEDEKRQGHQEYALEFSIGGKEYSYKIDWAAPANLPLFVGANIQKMLEDGGSDADVSAFTAFLRGIGNTFEPILSLSCMSSLNELFETGRYAEKGEALYSVIASGATSYLTQGIPSILRQTDQAMQKYKQTTFANSADPTIRGMERTAANIPFAGNLFKTEKVNQWGQKEENGNLLNRALNAYVNPGTMKEIDNSPLEQEITRLNGAQENSVSPRDAGKVISYTDKNGVYHENVRLSEDQYQTFAAVQGQNAKRIADGLVQSRDYNALTDKQKAAALNLAYDYAADKARRAALDGYPDASGWMAGIDGKEAVEIIKKVNDDTLQSAMNDLTAAWANGWDDSGKKNALSESYDTLNKMGKSTRDSVIAGSSSTVQKYAEARNAGISNGKYADYLKARVKEERKKGGTLNQGESIKLVSGVRNISDQQREVLMKQEVSDTQDENIDQVKAFVREYGLPQNYMNLYAESYDVVQNYTKGTGKKNRTVNHLMDMYGITWTQAKELYEILK